MPRAALTMTRAAFETTDRIQPRPASAPRPARAAAADRPPRDWSAVRQGLREVFLTLAATLALGFAWAAIEGERLEAAEVARLETGYAAVQATGR